LILAGLCWHISTTADHNGPPVFTLFGWAFALIAALCAGLWWASSAPA
jgi:hypothetical protein